MKFNKLQAQSSCPLFKHSRSRLFFKTNVPLFLSFFHFFYPFQGKMEKLSIKWQWPRCHDKLVNLYTNNTKSIENSAISILKLLRYILQITARKNIFGINKNALAVSFSQRRIIEHTAYRTPSTFEALAVLFHQLMQDLEFLFMAQACGISICTSELAKVHLLFICLTITSTIYNYGPSVWFGKMQSFSCQLAV